jgi:hypothetical protein
MQTILAMVVCSFATGQNVQVSSEKKRTDNNLLVCLLIIEATCDMMASEVEMLMAPDRGYFVALGHFPAIPLLTVCFNSQNSSNI